MHYSFLYPEIGFHLKEATPEGRGKLLQFHFQWIVLASAVVQKVADIVGDEDNAAEIARTSAISMGMDFTEADFLNIETFASRVVNLSTTPPPKQLPRSPIISLGGSPLLVVQIDPLQGFQGSR